MTHHILDMPVTEAQVRNLRIGDQVTLEISPFDDTAGRLPGSVNVQRLVTTVSGRLGEWIALGGSDIDTQDTQREIAGHGVKSASHQRRLFWYSTRCAHWSRPFRQTPTAWATCWSRCSTARHLFH